MKTILILSLLFIAGICTAQTAQDSVHKPSMTLVPSLSNAVYQVYTDGKDTNVVVTTIKLNGGLIELPDALAKITGKWFVCVDGLTEDDLKILMRKIGAMRELNIPINLPSKK